VPLPSAIDDDCGPVYDLDHPTLAEFGHVAEHDVPHHHGIVVSDQEVLQLSLEEGIEDASDSRPSSGTFK
jgi:hypothetical protein